MGMSSRRIICGRGFAADGYWEICGIWLASGGERLRDIQGPIQDVCALWLTFLRRFRVRFTIYFSGGTHSRSWATGSTLLGAWFAPRFQQEILDDPCTVWHPRTRLCESTVEEDFLTANTSMIYLMYHELELPGRALCKPEPGYVRYVVSESHFRLQINWLRDSGWAGMNVSQAMESPREHAVAITFDDGAESDLVVAAPLLKDAGFQATFYITVGFLGKRGYLSHSQLRELHGLGFEIGCHSMTHPHLNDLDSAGLQREIAGAKHELEQILGAAVNNFACPGGRYDQRAREVACQAGYASVATSRPHANLPTVDRLALGRVVIMRGTPLREFQYLCQGRGLWKKQFGVAAYQSAKSLLGNERYDQIRAMLLRRKSSPQDGH